MPKRLSLENVTEAELAPLEALFDPGYPERLRDMAISLFLELKSLDADVPPHEMALALTERVSTELGGGQFYMHKGFSYRLTNRDRQIMREFTGNNHHLLAKKHNLSDMRVRQIVNAFQLEAFTRNQRTLPMDGDTVPAPL
jgi:Mor family transcriptional regulator